jgi:hypothetical protein
LSSSATDFGDNTFFVCDSTLAEDVKLAVEINNNNTTCIIFLKQQ